MIDTIINSPTESRKEQLLHTFEEAARKSSSNTRFKFWEHGNYPILPESTEMYNQRLNYLHCNAVTACFVAEPWHWLAISGLDYLLTKKGCRISHF